MHWGGAYAVPSVEGRSHGTEHHYVAERFFGRSATRRGEQRERVFATCPWGLEGRRAAYCYECHEELLHNPVFTPNDIACFAQLVASRGLNEDDKPQTRDKLAGRITLLHEIIAEGLNALYKSPATSSERWMADWRSIAAAARQAGALLERDRAGGEAEFVSLLKRVL